MVILQHGPDAPVLQAHVHNLAKHDGAIAARPRQLRAVRGPADVHDRPALLMALGVSPAHAVAQLQAVERADRKQLAAWAPCNRRDDVVERRRLEHEPAVAVPHLVLAVLAAGNDHVVDGTPVYLEHDALVGLPRHLRGGMDGVGWVCGWVSGWLVAWMDGWVCGCVGVWIAGTYCRTWNVRLPPEARG